MSEKKAKENRNQPTVYHTMVAQFMTDGGVRVTGIPLNFAQAMTMTGSITKAVANYFVKASGEARMNGDQAEPKRIISLS